MKVLEPRPGFEADADSMDWGRAMTQPHMHNVVWGQPLMPCMFKTDVVEKTLFYMAGPDHEDLWRICAVCQQLGWKVVDLRRPDNGQKTNTKEKSSLCQKRF